MKTYSLPIYDITISYSANDKSDARISSSMDKSFAADPSLGRVRTLETMLLNMFKANLPIDSKEMLDCINSTLNSIDGNSPITIKPNHLEIVNRRTITATCETDVTYIVNQANWNSALEDNDNDEDLALTTIIESGNYSVKDYFCSVGDVDHEHSSSTEIQARNNRTELTTSTGANMNDKFEVLENAGMFNEVEIDSFPTYQEAKDYIKGNYSSDEIEELKVDITCNGSTEF